MTARDDYHRLASTPDIGFIVAKERDAALDEIDRLRATLDDEIVKRDTAIHLGRLEFAQSGKWQEMAEDLWEELQLWHADGCPTKWTSRAPGECTCHRILATRWDEITHAADWADDGLEAE